MENVHILVAEEDISLALDIAQRLKQLNFRKLNIVHSESDALAAIEKSHPDIALIDIKLNDDYHQMKVCRRLDKKRIPFMVMTQNEELSHYDEILALQPLAYFGKPLDYLALKYTIDAYFLRSGNGKNFDKRDHHQKKELIHYGGGDFLFLKKGGKYLKVKYRDMFFVQAEGNYITLQTNETKFVIRGSLKRCLKTMFNDQFTQVHRNYAVNMSLVESYNAEQSQLIVANITLPVGRSYRSGVRKIIKARL